MKDPKQAFWSDLADQYFAAAIPLCETARTTECACGCITFERCRCSIQCVCLHPDRLCPVCDRDGTAAHPDQEARMPAEVNVRYEDTEWPVDLKGMTTVMEILLFSLINHGLPTMVHERFVLLDAAGAELEPGNAIFAGIKPGDVLTLKYVPDRNTTGV